MGEWIGDRAGEAVSILYESYKELNKELNKAHEILDNMDVERWEDYGDLSRPLYLDERIIRLNDRLEADKLLLIRRIVELEKEQKKQ